MFKGKKIIVLCLLFVFIASVILLNMGSFKKEESTTYRVTFDSNGGSLVREQLVDTKENVIIPKTPTKEGYIFIEWQYDNNKFDFNAGIEKDIVLKAKWLKIEEEKEVISEKVETTEDETTSKQVIKNEEKKPNNKTPEKETNKEEIKKEVYTVTFDSNGGSKVEEQTIIKDGMITKPNNPTREGYIFINWTLDDKEYKFNTKITNNITLVANWSMLGDVNNDNEINAKDTVFLKRYLANWDVSISLINADVNLDGEVDDIDLAIITRYRMNEIDKLPYDNQDKYAIKFNLNGGCFEENEYVPKKYAEITGTIQYAEFSVIKEGYVFIGWTGSNGDIPQKSIEIKNGTTGDLEYNANWELSGDVNIDGEVDVLDLVLISQYLDGMINFTNNQKLIADVNLDGNVDKIDTDILAKYISDGGTNPDGYNIRLPYTS